MHEKKKIMEEKPKTKQTFRDDDPCPYFWYIIML